MYVRVREKLLAPIISHFSTPYFHSPSSLIKFPSPPTFFFTSSRCLLILFLLPTKQRVVFQKRQVTFHKTTGYFSQNDKSLFIKRRVVFSPKQDTRCTTIKLTNICSVDKSVHCVTHFFKKRHFYFARKNIISIFALHIHILKHFPYGC